MRQFLSKKTATQPYKFLPLIILFVCFVLMASVVSMSLFRMQQDDAGLQISYPFKDAGYSSIAAESDGDVHVVWHDNISGNYQLYYNRISGDLFQIWQTAKQITESPGDAMYPSIAMDTQGNIHVVWQDNRYGNWDIFYIKLDNTGYSLISSERVTDDPGDSIRPKISIDSLGDVQITWYDNRNGNYDIFWDKRVEPELTLVNLTLTPEKPMNGETTEVAVTLQNNGNNIATGVDVEFLVDDVLQEFQTVTAEAISEQVLSFEWIAEYGIHELKIQVDPDNNIAESDEENNIEAYYVRVYDSTVFSNMTIWADATLQYTVDVDVVIESVADPNVSGTPNNIGKFVNFSVDTYFDNAMIRIGYDEGELEAMGVDEETLKMYYWDPYDSEGKRWVRIEDSGVNAEEDYVWANISHFSIFAPLVPEGLNQPPNEPSDPDPEDGATNVSVDTSLYWTGGDPDLGDTVTYDIYFGNVSPPPQIESNWTDTIYDPPCNMDYNTIYYWQIVAWDSHGASTTGPIWDFTTEELINVIVTGLSIRWNLVSVPFNQSVNKTDFIVRYNGSDYSWQEAVNSGIIVDFIYEWDRSTQIYEIADTLYPGYGYWMYAYYNCSLKRNV